MFIKIFSCLNIFVSYNAYENIFCRQDRSIVSLEYEMILHMQHKALKERITVIPCHHFEPWGWGLAIATRAIMMLQ